MQDKCIKYKYIVIYTYVMKERGYPNREFRELVKYANEARKSEAPHSKLLPSGKSVYGWSGASDDATQN